MTEPCLCGADDCKHCHPENFKYGQYIPPEGDWLGDAAPYCDTDGECESCQ